MGGRDMSKNPTWCVKANFGKAMYLVKKHVIGGRTLCERKYDTNP